MAADPYKVLVIEDDPDLAHLTGMILESGASMTTALACDAVTALEHLQQTRFDLIVADIELPGRSGLQLLPDIHRLAPGVPVIFLTAHARLDYAVEALRGGANEFLAKPIQAAPLVARAVSSAHLFPIFLTFRGGKGVAPAAGVLLALDPLLGLATLGVWLLIAYTLRYSSLSALVAAATAPLIAFFLWGRDPLLAAVAIIAMALVAKHWANLQRLMAGTEPKIGARKKA